jgi:hypothetical protein
MAYGNMTHACYKIITEWETLGLLNQQKCPTFPTPTYKAEKYQPTIICSSYASAVHLGLDESSTDRHPFPAYQFF